MFGIVGERLVVGFLFVLVDYDCYVDFLYVGNDCVCWFWYFGDRWVVVRLYVSDYGCYFWYLLYWYYWLCVLCLYNWRLLGILGLYVDWRVGIVGSVGGGSYLGRVEIGVIRVECWFGIWVDEICWEIGGDGVV